MADALRYTIVSGSQATDVVLRMVSDGSDEQENRQRLKVFLKFAERYGIDLSRQAIAERDDQVVGYCFCLVNPGRTANIFLPERFPDATTDFHQTACNLVRLIVSQMSEWDLGILQAMAQDENAPTAKVFFDSGFSLLCRLNVMERQAKESELVSEAQNIAWINARDVPEERFASLIVQSYEGSKDCPQLTGLRTGKEILEGHRSAGIFEPAGWWLMRNDGQDAGILLMNRTEEDADRLELIYMGLVPSARGAGLGRTLLRKAAEIAHKLKMKTVRLAVDCDNVPALRLYREFGFLKIGNQTVLAMLNEARRTRLKRQERNDGSRTVRD